MLGPIYHSYRSWHEYSDSRQGVAHPRGWKEGVENGDTKLGGKWDWEMG